MDIITRDAAREQGLKRFFTGKPCKRGHVVPRYTSTGQCPECINECNRTYYKQNPDKFRAKSKRQYQEAMADECARARLQELNRERSARFRDANRELCNERAAASEAKKPEQYKAKRAAWIKEKYATDPVYRATSNLRLRVLQALKKCATAKSAATQELLGCTYEEARQHLASLFLPGMSWENHGEWEIDHIRPCASFDLTDPAQQRACFHYTNLQPLWRSENRRKKDRIDWERVA